jgi:hypothetical protein
MVLALLASNFVTFTICKRRVRELQNALVAKRTFLGRFEGSFEKKQLMYAGDTMTLVDSQQNILEIHSRDCTEITVKVFDR